MADPQKITEFTESTAPVADDILIIVDDIPGVPDTKKVSLSRINNNFIRTAAESSATIVNFLIEPGNVKRYGAIGNGVVDDAAAFQTAINVADNGGPRTIRIPEGDFIVGTALAPTTELFGLIFEGDGLLSTTIRGSHSEGPVLTFNRCAICFTNWGYSGFVEIPCRLNSTSSKHTGNISSSSRFDS